MLALALNRAILGDVMSRSGRLVMLGALCVGVFLVGVELLVTAVALPSILADLSDWTQLRTASWMINGYLVAYVAVMPLAGRAADRYSVSTLFVASLVIFAVGSIAAGAAPDLNWLIGARVVQGLGAGAIVPLATAGASHLFEGSARARAIGLVGALTFIGMAAGPFVAATILDLFPAEGTAPLAPAWRWIFYASAPLAAIALLYAWAGSGQWRTTRNEVRLDFVGAILFTTAVAAGLIALTLLGTNETVVFLSALIAASAAVAWLAWSLLVKSPFLDLRFFADRTFTGAVLLSLLTGYALATALIGGAVFVDRVRYGGPAEQQLALGALAVAIAVGALGSGLLMRLGVVVLSLIGLIGGIGGLFWLSTASPTSPFELLVAGLAVFGLGFGLTVTARSTAAVEALGKRAFGVAAAGVTVARMLGMGVGLAALTVLGSNRIEALSVVLVDQAARDAVLPAELRGRPLEDYLVLNALESWAADQAAGILSTLFLVAAVVTAVAILPTLAMRNRPRSEGAAERGADKSELVDGTEDASRVGYAI
jgi:MFS family permease